MILPQIRTCAHNCLLVFALPNHVSALQARFKKYDCLEKAVVTGEDDDVQNITMQVGTTSHITTYLIGSII